MTTLRWKWAVNCRRGPLLTWKYTPCFLTVCATFCHIHPFCCDCQEQKRLGLGRVVWLPRLLTNRAANFLSKCQDVLGIRFLHPCVPSRRDNRQRSNSTSSGCRKVASIRFLECQCFIPSGYLIGFKENFPFVVLIRQEQRSSTWLSYIHIFLCIPFSVCKYPLFSTLTRWSASVRKN